MNRLKIIYRDPRELQPNPRNSKKHSQAQIEEIAASIEEFGFNRPIMIDDTDQIIYGHGTREAAIHLGLTEAPTVDGSHMSDRQKRAYMLADNKIAENSTWDMELLSEELSGLAEVEFDISKIGFDEQEIDSLLKSDPSILPDTGAKNGGARQPEPDRAAGPAPAEPATATGTDTRVTFHVSGRQADVIDAAISLCRDLYGEEFDSSESTNRNANAIALICEKFIEDNGEG